jgi:hypothetical protein
MYVSYTERCYNQFSFGGKIKYRRSMITASLPNGDLRATDFGKKSNILYNKGAIISKLKDVYLTKSRDQLDKQEVKKSHKIFKNILTLNNYHNNLKSAGNLFSTDNRFGSEYSEMKGTRKIATTSEINPLKYIKAISDNYIETSPSRDQKPSQPENVMFKIHT